MTARFWIGAGLAAVGMSFALSGSAAEPAADAQRDSAAAFEQVITANRVAEFGRREHDAQALLVAARMLQEVPFEDKGAAGSLDAAFTPKGLFAEAKTLAKGDPQLLMQISLAQSAGSRGVLSSKFGRGLVRDIQDVGARSVYGFVLKAEGGEPLRIGAIGDVQNKMVMRLIDQSGKVVCVDDNGDYAPVCLVRPKSASDFRVEIQNRSDTPTRAVILSN